MNRLRCTISCPLDTYSGYGKRALDLVKEIIRVFPEWDVEILSQRWGDCRQGYLKDHKEYELMGHIVGSMTQKPDIWIQITVPNEFQRVGTFNIGITAAMETNLSDASWVEGVNRMDLVFTSSKHGKDSLINSVWTNTKTQKELRVTTPVEVLFEGMDPKYVLESQKEIKTPVLNDIKNSWNYLCVGHWLKGDFGQDRKNIGYTIKVFLETFKDREGQVPGLILKTSQAVSSILDREEILKRIERIRESVKYTKSLPNIYLLHGDLTDDEMIEVYRDPRVKAMVSFTKGEGFGRPLLEFAMTGKPVIASAWSGHKDFLWDGSYCLVGGTLENVHESATVQGMILPGAKWFTPNDSEAQQAYLSVFSNYDEWHKKSEYHTKKWLRKFWDRKTMGDLFRKLVELNILEFPEQVELKLPVKFE